MRSLSYSIRVIMAMEQSNIQYLVNSILYHRKALWTAGCLGPGTVYVPMSSSKFAAGLFGAVPLVHFEFP
jgi:hypothetical protein